MTIVVLPQVQVVAVHPTDRASPVARHLAERKNINILAFEMQSPPSPKIFETSDVGISPETARQPDTPGRAEAKCNFSKLFLESSQTSKVHLC